MTDLMRRRAECMSVLVTMLLLYPSVAPGQISLEAIFSPDPDQSIEFGGSPAVDLLWAPDGRSHLQPQTQEDFFRPPLSVDVESGASRALFELDRLADSLAAVDGLSREDAGILPAEEVRLSPDQRALLIAHKSDLFHFSIVSGATTRLTRSTEAEEVARFSPDGQWVAYVRNHDLHAVRVDGRQDLALTEGGGPDLLRGKLDWVYQEEIYGRGNYQGHWWSPDSRHLAFLELDESPVYRFPLVDHLSIRGSTEIVPYPKAGDPNPLVHLGIATVDGSPTVWVDTTQYSTTEILITRVGWTPDCRKLVFLVQNREQTWLDINLADPATGEMVTLLRETSPAFVDVDLTGAPHWLVDGSFLWLSGRSGYHHLYHFSPTGDLLGQLTRGSWEVRELYGIDPATGWIYFAASEFSPIEVHLYRVRLDGSGFARLSTDRGSHSGQFDPTFSRYLDTWSDIDTPPRVTLHSASGELVRTVAENPVPALAELDLPQVEFLQVDAPDGFIFEAALIKPLDFDPARTYPVLQYNYGGPHAQTVRNRWGGSLHLWLRYLAQEGYVVWMCDNRSASGKGIAPTWAAHGRLGELELADLESCLDWLARHPWVDRSRIGLYGRSFGGFLTSFALTHSSTFRAGIAFAPVTDWRLYDSIYTERYMQRPQDNPEGYRETSVVEAAGQLHGRLLLIHGTMDDNVHLQNTVQLAYALQRAGKSFDLMLYPDSRHGVRDPAQIYHLYRLMTRFLAENL